MEVVPLQVFVSLGLVVGSILLFVFTCRERTFEHAERLALLPIEDDALSAPHTQVLRTQPEIERK